MNSLADLATPALLIDADKLAANIATMADRAARLGVRLRPHIKTHKCVEIAELQRRAGCRGLTVSTLFEARVFAEHGPTVLPLDGDQPLRPAFVGLARRGAGKVSL